MSVGGLVSDALGRMFILAIVGVVLLFGILIYSGYRVCDSVFNDESIESQSKIIPTYKLTVSDNKIDTVWVYTSKK